MLQRVVILVVMVIFALGPVPNNHTDLFIIVFCDTFNIFLKRYSSWNLDILSHIEI